VRRDPDQQAADAFLAAVRAFAGGTFAAASPAPGELVLTPITEPRRAVHLSFLQGGVFISLGSFTAESDVALAGADDANDPACHFSWALTKITCLVEYGSFRRLPLLELVIASSVDEARSLANSLLTLRYSRPWWEDHNRREAIAWSGPDTPTTRAELSDRLTRELRDRWNHWEGRPEAGVDPLSAAGTASALIPVTREDYEVIVNTFSTQLVKDPDGDLDVDAAVEWLLDRYGDRLPGTTVAP